MNRLGTSIPTQDSNPSSISFHLKQPSSHDHSSRMSDAAKKVSINSDLSKKFYRTKECTIEGLIFQMQLTMKYSDCGMNSTLEAAGTPPQSLTIFYQKSNMHGGTMKICQKDQMFWQLVFRATGTILQSSKLENCVLEEIFSL